MEEGKAPVDVELLSGSIDDKSRIPFFVAANVNIVSQFRMNNLNKIKYRAVINSIVKLPSKKHTCNILLLKMAKVENFVSASLTFCTCNA